MLNKSALESAILSAFISARTGTDRTDTLPSMASALANAIDTFIKSGDVQPGIPVQTNDAQGGTNTGVTISIGKVL